MLKHLSIHLRLALRKITREQAQYERTRLQTREQWLKDYDKAQRRERRR